ncbi:M23 family metallopeptidase [Paenibacillus chitinolyticus]|uniref:M23 family metallopeptidase n=1 Tax=Paenibacillus chitinolyticus TaxID=79263 RepID=UPI001C491813|nr:M23 family metallopeptidase [Paenibacillus chitinolyticus]MBV6717205.1 M23 family metallopeptidase [Paenibacillus chitinolyticus]
MPAWAIKVGIQVLRDPDKAIKWAFLGLMLILVLPVMLVLPFYFLFIPAAEPEQFKYYKAAAEQIASETEGQLINYKEMIALDAVLLEQDFTKSSADRAHHYFKSLFIWEEEVSYPCSTTDADGNETTSTCYKTVYHSRSLDEVMINLGFTEEQKEMVRNYLLIDIDEDDNLGAESPNEVPPGDFKPSIGSFIWPSDYYQLTSGFGGRVDPVTGIPGEIHGGIDIRAPKGSQVKAAMDGVVTQSFYSESGGNIIKIDHKNGYSTRYLHLDTRISQVGDQVKQGQVIALSGNTGKKTTGAHLHFEIHVSGKKTDPMQFYK